MLAQRKRAARKAAASLTGIHVPAARPIIISI